MPEKNYRNPQSERMVDRLSNTSWVAWDLENDQPLIETYAGRRSEQTIEFHDDGRCVAGMDGCMYYGTWAILERAGQRFLHLLFGNEDDNLAITATIDAEGMTLSSSFSKYYELLFSGELRPKRYKTRKPTISHGGLVPQTASE